MLKINLSVLLWFNKSKLFKILEKPDFPLAVRGFVPDLVKIGPMIAPSFVKFDPVVKRRCNFRQ